MGIDFESIVEHPRDEVWAWHTRPGAIHRLTPPWQPMSALAEAESLADGTAVLRLPGGLRWVARHDPTAYQPPYRFVDELSSGGVMSWPVRLAGGWRHTHTFEDVDGTRTRMRDRVESAVPAGMLRPMFVYRHRQVADDLAAHRRASDAGLATPTVVAVTGASGLVGVALSAFLTTGGHRVIRLVRRPAQGGHAARPGAHIPDARPQCRTSPSAGPVRTRDMSQESGHQIPDPRRRGCREIVCASEQLIVVQPGSHDLAVAVVGKPGLQQVGVDLGVELQSHDSAQYERL